MKKKVVMSGFGNVGREVVKLIYEKREYIKRNYDLELILCGLIGRGCCIFENDGLDIEALLNFGLDSDGILEYAKIKKESYYDYPVFEGDIFVECTKSNVETGGLALEYIISSVDRGMDTVIVSKGALATHFNYILELAKNRNVSLKYSAATAGALPVMDMAEYGLAGCEVTSIEGILNGTTNYILTKAFEDNLTQKEALNEAISMGITEKDNYLDIDGIDSACKILMLANSFMGTKYNIEDVEIRGIRGVYKEDILEAKRQNKVIKLMCRAYYEEGEVKLKVSPELVEKESYFGMIEYKNKGVIFNTKEVGKVGICGGASNVKAAASAALKDIINISR